MRNIRLHTKFLLLLVSVSLVPLIVVAGVLLVRFQTSLQADAGRLGQQLAATAAAEIQTFMTSQFGVLDSIAALHHPDFPIEPATAARITEIILLRSENFMDISIADASGTEIARKNRLLVILPEDFRNLAGTPAFESVREDGIYVGPVYIRSGRPFFDFGRRVLDSQGNFSGAVFAQVDAQVMPSVVERISRIVAFPGRVFIVDERGVVIAYPDLSYMLAERDLSGLPPVRGIMSGAHQLEPATIYENELGNRVLGTAHPMTIELFDLRAEDSPSINWFVVAEQPEDAVYGEARNAAWFSILVSFAAIVAASAAAIFFAGRVSRPIEDLHTAALEFGKGNLAYRAQVQTADEIGDLAQSFNKTAETLATTITSLKNEEQVTSAERNKLQVILSGITNAVVAVDVDRNVILFNKSAEVLTGRKMGEVLGKPVQGLFTLHEGDREVGVDEYCPQGAEEIDGSVYSKRELKMTSTTGEEHFVNLVAGRIREGHSINLGCVLTFQDITREFAMDRTKREFVSIAAHQLRTPLTGMTWTVEYLLSEAKGTLNEAQKTIVNQAMDATRRMIELVNDLLDISRIEEGRFGVKMERQSITPVLERIVQALQKQAAKKGVELRAQLAADMPPLDFDAGKIGFVFGNLIDNAIKYTPQGGHVEVVAEQKDGSVAVSVSDTGIGIPESEYDRVFSKFFRSRKALLYHTDGSGLGLYVANNIVVQHKGHISFESRENQGTKFLVTLPIPSGPPVQEETQPTANPTGGTEGASPITAL